jgi:hypothetical protein
MCSEQHSTHSYLHKVAAGFGFYPLCHHQAYHFPRTVDKNFTSGKTMRSHSFDKYGSSYVLTIKEPGSKPKGGCPQTDTHIECNVVTTFSISGL